MIDELCSATGESVYSGWISQFQDIFSFSKARKYKHLPLLSQVKQGSNERPRHRFDRRNNNAKVKVLYTTAATISQLKV